MKTKFLIIIAGLAISACNSNGRTDTGDSTVSDSITNTADSLGTDTMDHSGNLQDSAGMSNGTTYTDSI